jgi:PAS domain S-box-containing protein
MKSFLLNMLIGFLFLFIVTAHSSFALDPHKAISQYTHSNWQTEEGLPQIAVQCITQTSDGYLWIGTQEGVVRFDGVKFTVFDRANTQGINHNSIRSLLQTADGSLWLGTEGGLTRMYRGIFTVYTRTDGLANINVADLYEDVQQNLWIATSGGGLSVWKNGQFTTFTMKDGLLSNDITSVTGGNDGTIYIGTDAGLAEFSNGSFTTYTTDDGLADNNVRAVYYSPDDVLWVGTSAGLCRFKNGKWKTFTTKDGLVNNQVRSIRQDHDGNLWIGTNGGGLSRMWDTQISSYTTYDGLIDGYVLALYEDSEGSFWVGTVSGGLHRFRDGSFVVYGEKEGLAQDNTRAIYEARDGSIWIGADIHGLTHFKNGTLKIQMGSPAIANNGARGICEGPDGTLWIGTYGGGLSRLKDGKFTTFTEKNGLANDIILCLFITKDSTLWIGTRDGLSLFKNDKFTNYTTNQGLASDVVRMILQVRDGSVWICTDGGLNRFHEGTLTKYTTENGLSYNMVYSIFEDGNKALWIGTYGGGLNRFKDGRFTVFTTKQGMYDNAVFQILEDNQKYFWLTCNRGIYRVSEKELNEYADGKIQSVHCTVFGTTDGMRSAKCNGTSQPAGIRARDGRLWIPTMKGVAIIDPARLDRMNHPPPIFIEQVLFDKQLTPDDSLVQLGPGKGELEFHYTALSYAAPKLISFKYMLVGYDKDWIDAGTRRIAYYTNIPPGSYTFKVIACNNEGVWNLDGASIGVDLDAYFYQTNWFLGLSVLTALFAGLGIYRMRVLDIQRHERELVQLVDDPTKNLQEEITERKLAEEALRDSEEKFRTFAEQSPNMIFINHNGNVIYANAKCEEQMEYTKEEFYSPDFNFLKITAPESVELLKKAFSKHTRGEEVPAYEYTILTKHGKRIDVIITTKLIPYENRKAILGIITDITERKKAEESLLKFRLGIERSSDAVFITDPSGIIIFVNPAFEQLYGYSFQESVGNTPRILKSGTLSSEDYKRLWTTLLSKNVVSGEIVNKTKDGRLVHIEGTNNPILDDQGKIIGFLGIHRDITDWKREEEKLQQSFSLIQATLESTADGILVVDRIGTITNYNAQFVKMWNIPENIMVDGKDREAINFVLVQLKSPKDFVSKLKELYSHPEKESFDVLEFKDGRIFERYSHPQRIDGRPVGRVWSFRDVTQRKLAEEQLQESEERYRRLVESSPDAIAVHSEGKFVFVNSAAIKLIGAVNESQLIGLPVLSVIHPDDVDVVRQRIFIGMTERKALPPMEEKFVRLDGSIVEVEVISLPIIFQGKPAMQVVARDITDQKKLQNQLLQSQKIQSLGTLAGGIAHDFNNILAIILGYSSTLEKNRNDAQKHAEGIAAINQAIDRGAALVRQILTFARKTDITFEPLSIPDLLHELLSMLKQTFSKTITFTQTYTPDLPDIIADRTQIHQTLLNLCVNARDAMPNGGSITIKAEQRTKEEVSRRFPSATQETYVCISVTDTGMGMDEATCARVFDPFFTTKENGKGTGLGLSVVYGVMQSHHGFVDVESRMGEGTTFYLFFPVSPMAERPMDEVQLGKEKPSGGTETILFIEDEYLILKVIRRLLKSYGYSVYVAADGEEALEVFARHRDEIDLVLSDVGLPKMSGIDVFKKLKEMDPHMKVVLASGFFEPDLKFSLHQLGAKGFIQKPYSNDEVLRKLREVLDEKSTY